MKLLSFIAAFLLLCASCAKKKIPENDSLLGLGYFPTTQGKYVIYDVDSTVYTEIPSKDTFYYKYRIKEKIADGFTDNEGKPAIRLERYIKMFNPNKSYDSIPWTIKEVWMLNADKRSVQLSERDIRYTKLIFPIQEKVMWKGNVRNNLGDWDYEYTYIDKSEKINNVQLDKVLLVTQFNLRTFIDLHTYTEKYAKDIGLVYRAITTLSSTSVVSNVPVENRIELGLIYEQKIVSYGYE